MNLFLLEQNSNSDYDTFVSCIVAAKTAGKARLVHPTGIVYTDKDRSKWRVGWVDHPREIEVILIGKARVGTEENTVILASLQPK